MVIIGIDAHKRSHTEQGRRLAERTVGSSWRDHLVLIGWAARRGSERLWAVEDCRHLSRRLERDLLVAGERIVRVPPKLMAHARDGARSYGKSDAIDALAVARTALREPQLPQARLDGPERELRLLVDHREDLVAERTRVINRLRWHLHELDPAGEPKPGALTRQHTLEQLAETLTEAEGLVAQLACELVRRCKQLTLEIQTLEQRSPPASRRSRPHCSRSAAAAPSAQPRSSARQPILGETAGVERFRSADAYARHNGTAPIPVSSAGHTHHRLSRTGNRQLNAALYRIALTQSQWHPQAQTLLARRQTQGDSKHEALRVLKRRLSDVVYRALKADAQAALPAAA
jgi:transposase